MSEPVKSWAWSARTAREKRTTLRCLVGVIPPASGEISICGHSIKTDPIGAKQQLAFMPDEPRLFDYLTVMEHLQFTARMYGITDFRAAANAAS